MVSVVLVGNQDQYSLNAIASLSCVEMILQPFDGNYNRSLNKAFKLCQNDYIAFCNNDVIFTERWFENMLPYFDTFDSVSPSEERLSEPFLEGYKIRTHIKGWCIVMKRETYLKIGGFDESVAFWYSDNIYAEQLKKHKLRHAVIGSSIVHHVGSATLKTLSIEQQKELTTGQRPLFLNRKLNMN